MPNKIDIGREKGTVSQKIFYSERGREPESRIFLVEKSGFLIEPVRFRVETLSGSNKTMANQARTRTNEQKF